MAGIALAASVRPTVEAIDDATGAPTLAAVDSPVEAFKARVRALNFETLGAKARAAAAAAATTTAAAAASGPIVGESNDDDDAAGAAATTAAATTTTDDDGPRRKRTADEADGVADIDQPLASDGTGGKEAAAKGAKRARVASGAEDFEAAGLHFRVAASEAAAVVAMADAMLAAPPPLVPIVVDATSGASATGRRGVAARKGVQYQAAGRLLGAAAADLAEQVEAMQTFGGDVLALRQRWKLRPHRGSAFAMDARSPPLADPRYRFFNGIREIARQQQQAGDGGGGDSSAGDRRSVRGGRFGADRSTAAMTRRRKRLLARVEAGMAAADSAAGHSPLPPPLLSRTRTGAVRLDLLPTRELVVTLRAAPGSALARLDAAGGGAPTGEVVRTCVDATGGKFVHDAGREQSVGEALSAARRDAVALTVFNLVCLEARDGAGGSGTPIVMADGQLVVEVTPEVSVEMAMVATADLRADARLRSAAAATDPETTPLSRLALLCSVMTRQLVNTDLMCDSCLRPTESVLQTVADSVLSRATAWDVFGRLEAVAARVPFVAVHWACTGKTDKWTMRVDLGGGVHALTIDMKAGGAICTDGPDGFPLRLTAADVECYLLTALADLVAGDLLGEAVAVEAAVVGKWGAIVWPSRGGSFRVCVNVADRGGPGLFVERQPGRRAAAAPAPPARLAVSWSLGASYGEAIQAAVAWMRGTGTL